VLQTVATEERGIDELLTALQGHRDWLRAGGPAGPRRRALAEAQILRQTAARVLAQTTARTRRREDWSDLVQAVAAGRLSAAGAAALVLGQAEVEAS
jgi:LAO/AO transport system kinase